MIKSLILGAGREVGKSCVVVTLGGRTIMFDCGMHLGYEDSRRFPDFSLITKDGNCTDSIDCIIITHFHLDHVGALPYFTEVCGYGGPIFMTYPTKALTPLMLEDYRKVMVEKRGEQEQYSVVQIRDCIKKVTAVDLKQTISVSSDIQFRAYYAGHVLGAAMFYVRVGQASLVYTGDYNMTPDRHLGAAQIDRLQPDLVITESTYATTIKDSKYAREQDFLKAVHKCVATGGKVLIPVFALGRAQELCILLDDYWERMGLEVPIYFAAGLTMQANVYYKLLIGWTSQKVKDMCVTRNAFDFKHVSSFERSRINEPGPCVLFATPGMLSGGLSLDVFKQWAPFEQNMVVVPGYCVPGTVGHNLFSGKFVTVDIDNKRTKLKVCCQVHHLSFTAHTDAKGIMDLLRHVGAKHVILVHGENKKMAMLKAKITSELGVPCFDPGNGEVVEVPSRLVIKVLASEQFLAGSDPWPQGADGACLPIESRKNDACVTVESAHLQHSIEDVFKQVPVARDSGQSGIIVIDSEKMIKVLQTQEAFNALNISRHTLVFKCFCPVSVESEEENAMLVREGLGCRSTHGGDERLEEVATPSKKRHRGMVGTKSFPAEADDIDSNCSMIELTVARGTRDAPYLVYCGEGDSAELSWNNAGNILHAVHIWLTHMLGSHHTLLTWQQDCVIIGCSVHVRVGTDEHAMELEMPKNVVATLVCSWSIQDEELANQVISLIGRMRLRAQ